MNIKLQCGCGKILKAPPNSAGQRTKCPGCGAFMTIPGSKVTVAAGDTASGEMWRVKELCTIISENDDADYLFTSLAISSNGKYAISGSRVPAYHGRALRLWNLPEGFEITDCGEEAEALLESLTNVQAVAFSPDGRRVACASSSPLGKQIAVFKVGESLEVHKFEAASELLAQGEILSLAFSPDGRYLAAGGRDGIWVWGLKSGKQYHRFEKAVKCVLFSPDNRYVFTGELGEEDSAYNDVIAWSLETGKIARRYRGHTDWVNCLAFSPDGKHLLSGSGGDAELKKNDYSVRLWNYDDREQTRYFDGYSGRVGTLAFTQDGKLYVAAGLEFREKGMKSASDLIDDRPPCEQWIFAHVRRVSDGKILGKYEAKVHTRVAPPGDPRKYAFAARHDARLIVIAEEKPEIQVFKTAPGLA